MNRALLALAVAAQMWCRAPAQELSLLPDKELAVQDRNQFPPELWPGIYHLTTRPVRDLGARQQLATAMKLTLMLCSRNRVITQCRPVQLSETLYRINLYDLGWDPTLWKQVVARNSYHELPDQLVLRADWFVLTMMDLRDSNSYYLMTFGAVPKTVDDAWRLLDVITDRTKRYGFIEGDSKVSKQGVRRIESLPCIRGNAYRTLDVLRLEIARDPLENAEQTLVDPKHDGEEHIILHEFHDPETGAVGVVPRYFLADGAGNIVPKADVRLVEDTTEFRGYREIAAPGSCVQCHSAGGNYPTLDDFKQITDAGVRRLDSPDTQRRLQAYYFRKIEKEIDRWNEDYDLMVKAQCGVSSLVASTHFTLAVRDYDANASLARVAWELEVEDQELRLALAWHQSRGLQLPARTAGLTEGQEIPRAALESGSYLALRQILQNWRAQ